MDERDRPHAVTLDAALEASTRQQSHPQPRSASDVQSDAVDGQQRSSTMRFLQRYYHVGAFFADERSTDDAFQRNFHSATGEDATVDKTTLPAVMQVKHFGLKGRTKYTHLADQDTTAPSTATQAHAHAHGSSDSHNIRRAAEVGVRGYTGKGALR